MADNQVDLKLNLDFQGVNDALYQMIGQFNGTDKEFQKIADNIQKNAKKLEASILVFGPASKQAANAQKALQANMLSLVANGVNPQIAAIGTLSQNYNSLNGILATTQTATNGTTSAISNSANSLKQSNKQWSALALVVQDLPYGFRGIQNNLPALFGSLATGAGAAYFAFSAVVAVITAMDMGLIKFGNTVKLTTDYSKEAANTYATETVQLDSLYRISQDVNVSMEDRLTAAESLIKEYPGLLGVYSAEDIALGKAVESYDKLREAVWAYAKVKAAEKVLIELGAKQNELTIKQNKITAQQNKANSKGLTAVNYAMYNNLSLTEQFYKFVNDLPVNGAFGPIVNSLPEMQKTTELLSGIKKEQEDLNDETKNYQDIIDGNILLSKLFKEVQTPDPKQKLNQDTSLLEKLKKEQKLYKDDLGMFYHYGSLIIQEEERLAIQRAEFEKASAQEILNIRSGFNSDMIVNQQEFGRAIMAEAEKNTKEYEKNEQEIAKIILSNREQIAEGIKKINSDINNENIANIQTQLKQTLKATKGNYQAQKTAIEDAIKANEAYKESAIQAGSGTEEFITAAKNLKAQLEGLVDPVEQLEMDFNKTINSIATGALVELGTQIGNVFSGVGFNMDGFLGLIANALIQLGTYLVTISSLFIAIKALFATGGALAPFAIPIGLAAIAAGVALNASISKKSAPKKFANGGIISGPTMGLMGEYPGASHNPEVVAPLDKLKSLIGNSGGGTLEARISGNDLLILMNKAGRNNNNTF
jgi:hypothetical protein